MSDFTSNKNGQPNNIYGYPSLNGNPRTNIQQQQNHHHHHHQQQQQQQQQHQQQQQQHQQQQQQQQLLNQFGLQNNLTHYLNQPQNQQQYPVDLSNQQFSNQQQLDIQYQIQQQRLQQQLLLQRQQHERQQHQQRLSQTLSKPKDHNNQQHNDMFQRINSNQDNQYPMYMDQRQHNSNIPGIHNQNIDIPQLFNTNQQNDLNLFQGFQPSRMQNQQQFQPLYPEYQNNKVPFNLNTQKFPESYNHQQSQSLPSSPAQHVAPQFLQSVTGIYPPTDLLRHHQDTGNSSFLQGQRIDDSLRVQNGSNDIQKLSYQPTKSPNKNAKSINQNNQSNNNTTNNAATNGSPSNNNTKGTSKPSNSINSVTKRQCLTCHGHTRPVVSMSFSFFAPSNNLGQNREIEENSLVPFRKSNFISNNTNGSISGQSSVEELFKSASSSSSESNQSFNSLDNSELMEYFILSGSKDNTPMIRSGITGSWVRSLEGHKGAVWATKITKDAKYSVTGSADFTAKVWDNTCGKIIYSMDHKHVVRSVDISDNHMGNKLVMTAGLEKKIRIFDLRAPSHASDSLAIKDNNVTASSTFEGHDEGIKTALLDSSNGLVFAGDGNKLRVWDLRTKQLVATREFLKNVISLQFTWDQTNIVCVTEDSVQLYNTRTASLLKSFSDNFFGYPLSTASVNPALNTLVVGSSRDLWIRLYDFNDGKELDVWKGHHGPVHTLQWSPDGELVASGSEDGTVRLWQSNPLTEYGTWKN